MEKNLQTIFEEREELMKDKWNENRPSKLACLRKSVKKQRKSQTSVAVNGKTNQEHFPQTCSMTIEQKYSNGETIFHLLARENQANAITDLLQQGHKIDKDDQGFYPWHVAAAHGNIEAVKSFYTHGNLQIHEPSEHYQFNILHVAVLGTGNTDKQTKMIEYIVNSISEIDINGQDVYGRTPLFCAGQYKKHELGCALLKLGADPQVLSSFRYSVLGMAATNCPNLTMTLMDR